jgi:glycerol kinase
MPARHVLAIDQGTTSSRALIVDASAEVVAVGQRTFAQHYPQPGWVEHDPEEIWHSQEAAIHDALRHAGLQPNEVAAIGIANQRETVVLWDRETGAPVHNAIVWQDRRTAAICDGLRAGGHEEAFRKLTGLTLDPYFSGTKLAWLLHQDERLAARAEAHRWQAPRHRLHQRQPHPALQHHARPLGRDPLRRPRSAARDSPRGSAVAVRIRCHG